MYEARRDSTMNASQCDPTKCISKTARRLPGTVAYLRVPLMLPVKGLAYHENFEFWMKVPKTVGYLVYHRVPSGTSAYQHAILLMKVTERRCRHLSWRVIDARWDKEFTPGNDRS